MSDFVFAVKRGTLSYRRTRSDALAPDEVAYTGAWIVDGLTDHMVWDAGLGNVRPMTAQEIANIPAQKKAAGDAANPALAALRDASSGARSNNGDFLSIKNPSTPQIAAQVTLLTQQQQQIIDALARLIAIAGV
jgi:hypothetical protein